MCRPPLSREVWRWWNPLCRPPLWCGGDGVRRVSRASPRGVEVVEAIGYFLPLWRLGVVEFIGSPLPCGVEMVGFVGFSPLPVVWRLSWCSSGPPSNFWCGGGGGSLGSSPPSNLLRGGAGVHWVPPLPPWSGNGGVRWVRPSPRGGGRGGVHWFGPPLWCGGVRVHRVFSSTRGVEVVFIGLLLQPVVWRWWGSSLPRGVENVGFIAFPPPPWSGIGGEDIGSSCSPVEWRWWHSPTHVV